ncbi:hypothetical protein MLD38_019021 [Melastoma candidum]|uniref:Uncharacterized protein n=1 Tax=Melastoma candidum TaxID=119954 RepID=A0ACB9QW89_9MYRT|nr:hypothetical protein MLD38_019021 [Melastoma candidum]
MCNIFSPFCSPTNPFSCLVSCFVDRDMPSHDPPPAPRPAVTARGLGEEESPFPTSFDDMSQLRSGLLHRRRRNHAAVAPPGYGYYNYYPYGAKPGKPIDPRMLPLLESFQELYFRRRDLFQRLFPKLHDEFAKFSEEIAAEARSKDPLAKLPRRLRRSQSVGSPRVVSRDIGGEQPLRLERFKVRPVDLDDDLPPPVLAGGTNKPGGSKSK